MEFIIGLIVTWGPALTAVLGVVTTVIVALGKTKDAIDSLKQDETFKQLKNELSTNIQENETIKSQIAEQSKQMDLLLDELTKIKDYRKNINQ